MTPTADSSTFFRPLLSVLGARKWIIIISAVLLPLMAVGVSLSEKPLYQASSQVLVTRTNLADVLTNTPNPTASEFDFNRIVQTEAQLAATPAVARAVIARAGLSETPKQFAAQSTVVTNPNSNIMTLSVSAGSKALATELASDYATEFVTYSQKQNLGTLRAAATNLRAQQRQLAPGSPAYSENQSELQRIQNLESLGNSTVNVVQTASNAVQTRPKTARNLILGLILGLVIGISLAFIFDRLDTHVRSGDEIQRRLQLPLLGRLPAPPRDVADDDRIVMLAEPAGRDAENFRVLRTNLMFADVDHRARTIMITSAIASEGKSTTVSNLAVALARGGQKVILADVDLRQPTLERYFDLPRSPGITSVLLGEATLEQALVEIPLDEAPSPLGHYGSRNGAAKESRLRQTGSLHIIPTGELPPNAGELVASGALRDLLRALSDGADVLLMDTPPLLQVSDAMALTTDVDAIILVSRLGVVRRRMLEELTRVLAAAPASTLGVVITDATAEPGGMYGYYYSYGEPTPADSAINGHHDGAADPHRPAVR
ncbi:MAG TPA: AAA family ATPase [Solirubrobacteraceae bacterium]|nr:AAA family ATPase [Solirubrobacteraceae bacterium]